MQQALKARALLQIALRCLGLGCGCSICRQLTVKVTSPSHRSGWRLMAELMLALAGTTFSGERLRWVTGIAGAIVAISAAIVILAGVKEARVQDVMGRDR